MPKIFLDTNIYLDFYERNKGMRKLLDALVKAAPSVFVTALIRDEVNRNKTQKVKEKFQGFLNQLQTNAILLHEHLSVAHDERLREWNKAFSEARQSLVDLKNQLRDLTADLLEEVRISSDAVSKELSVILDAAVSPTETNLSAARHRKEIGNPPGKRADPLGDQVSWVQLLEACEEGESVWLVSRDRDFFVVTYKSIRLNPILHEEIAQRVGKAGAVYCFTELREALKDFEEKTGSEALGIPEIEELAEEPVSIEMLYTPSPLITVTTTTTIPYGGTQASGIGALVSNPVQICFSCPSCGDSSGMVVPYMTVAGERSNRAHCARCGRVFDM